jgi:hypothetical protein
MGATNSFTQDELKNRTIQMQVRRLHDKIKEPSLPSSVMTGITDLSPMTEQTTMTAATTNATAASSVALQEGMPALKDPPPGIPEYAATPPKRKKRNSGSLDGVLEIRKTATGAQKQRINDKRIRANAKKAFKEATTLYSLEKTKDKKGKSCRKCVEEINKKYNTSIAVSTVYQYVRKDLVGTSPMKTGPQPLVRDDIFKLLLVAYESYVRIMQLNCEPRGLNRASLTKRVNAVLNKEISSGFYFNKLLAESSVDFKASVHAPVEDRRQRWTTYNNLNSWFENWERDIVQLGFGIRMDDGSVFVSEEQKGRILNLDESCCHLDGNKGQRGGTPKVTFYDGGLPVGGVAASKTAQSTTLITGSSALGEVLPPHFQFSTTAKSPDTMRIKISTVQYMLNVKGTFGFENEQVFPCTYGLNEKGGMDAKEFEEYYMTNIVRLYPDAADVPGKRVMTKIDSGPGRKEIDFNARLRNMGFYIYPCVPNTTAVTQETDQLYGPFKSFFRENLCNVSADRIEHNKPLSFSPHLLGLFVFGGTDPETNIGGYRNAFGDAFTREKCKAVWEKVGAIPTTRACLQDPKVRRELNDVDDEEDPMQLAMNEMQAANTNSTNLLSIRGYQGDLLKATLKEKKKEDSVTVPHSDERLAALAEASTHGAIFACTHGMHTTSDDAFIAAELPKRKTEIKQLEDAKKLRLDRKVRNEKAKLVLEMGKSVAQLRVADLDILLKWYEVENPTSGRAEQKRDRWQLILNSNAPPPQLNEWTEEDERKLDEAKSKKITMKDTALARLKALHSREIEATFQGLSADEQQIMLDRFQAMKDANITIQEGPEGGDELAQAEL